MTRNAARILFDQIVEAIETNRSRKTQREAFEDILIDEGIIDEISFDGSNGGNYFVLDDDGLVVAIYARKRDAEVYIQMFGIASWKVKEVV